MRLEILAVVKPLVSCRDDTLKVDEIKFIGKESNSLESVDEGMVHSEKNINTEYSDPKRTEWITKIQPALKKPKLEVLVEACGKRFVSSGNN